MKALTPDELAFLSAWAREDREPDCWSLPAHRLQALHKVPASSFIALIKAWARAEGKRDREIYTLGSDQAPTWPWRAQEELAARLLGVTGTAQPTDDARQTASFSPP